MQSGFRPEFVYVMCHISRRKVERGDYLPNRRFDALRASHYT